MRLIRANLEELAGRADNPREEVEMVLQDMRNQYLQLKTQTAIALAGLHVLEKGRNTRLKKEDDLRQLAEHALARGDEAQARTLLSRAISEHRLADGYSTPIASQRGQAELLSRMLQELDDKISSAEVQAAHWLATDRRARLAAQAAGTQSLADETVLPAMAAAAAEPLSEDPSREMEIERLLAEIKQRKAAK